MNNPGSTCPACGADLGTSAVAGLCPACVARVCFGGAEEDGPSACGGGGDGFRAFQLGAYEVLRELGRGGMGVVYEASQPGLGRLVALKVLHGHLADQPEFVRRFRAEAEAVAGLRHPHIVTVFEAGIAEGRSFFSMELVAGEDLGRRCAGRPMPVRQAAAVVATVARAVHAAHEQGILHRDLKPSNILLDHDGQPRITDFGLARRFVASADSPQGESGLTLSGQVVGSPSYLPPEQIASARAERGVAGVGGGAGRVGRWSDVYALGALLYQLTTGRPPFLAQTIEGTLLQVLESEPVAPGALQPAVPRDLETICLKCLEKRPRARYATAQEVAEDLERWAAGLPIRARPVGTLGRVQRWAVRRPLVAALCGALLLALSGGIAGVMWQWRRAEAAAARAQAGYRESRVRLTQIHVNNGQALLEAGDAFGALAWFAHALSLNVDDSERAGIHRLRYGTLEHQLPRLLWQGHHEGTVSTAAISPDGRWVVSAGDDKEARLWSIETANDEFTRLRHDGAVHFAAFSPSGDWVATAGADGECRLWRVPDGRPAGVATRHGGPVWRAAFSPDGRHLVTAGLDGTVRLRSLGEPSSPETVIRLESKVYAASFSPDGEAIVTGCEDGTARVWSVRDGTPRTSVLRHGRLVYAASFSPEGDRVVTASFDATARLWEAGTGAPIGAPLRHRRALYDAAFSPDGGRVATASTDGTALIWDARTSEPLGTPMQHAAPVSTVRFSPDGQRLLTASHDHSARVWQALTGEPLTPRLPHASFVFSAVFAAHSNRVLTASADGTSRMWELTPATASPLPLQGDAGIVAIGLDPEKRIVVAASSDGHIVGWDLEQGRPLFRNRVKDGGVATLGYSSQRSLLAVGGKRPGIRLLDVGAGDWLAQEFAHGQGVSQLAFSPDGGMLLGVDTEGRAVLWRLDRAVPPQVIDPDGTVTAAAFSADSRQILLGESTGRVTLWHAGDGQFARAERAHPAPVSSLAFHPDGSQFAVACQPENIFNKSAAYVYSGQATEPRWTFEHKSGVVHVAYSASGDVLVTGGADRMARVWDVRTGRPRFGALRHPRPLVGFAVDPRGQLLATASDEGAIRVWDLRTGEPVCAFSCSPARPAELGFGGRPGPLVVRDSLGRVFAFELTPETRPTNQILNDAERLAARRMDASGSLEAFNAGFYSRGAFIRSNSEVRR